MDTFYNWNQIRGLAFLAILGLFAFYALMVGVWHSLEAKAGAMRGTEQDATPSAKPTMASSGGNGTTEPHAWRDDRPVVASPRRAA